MRTILITGGAGFIGSHTAVELAAAGYGVVLVDNLANSQMSAVEGVRALIGGDVPFEMVDLRDWEATKSLFERRQPDAVVHFAAFKAIGESMANPLKYYENNIPSTVNTLRAMQEVGCKRIVFSSSAAVYGDQPVYPVTEDMPLLTATSPYGRTKQMCEAILRDAAAADSELKVSALRYFNPIGAHHSWLIGELPIGAPNNLMPYITQTAAGVRKELSIFGNDYPTPDGTCLRDYIDVVDLARAHVAAIDRLFEEHSRFEVFNIGTGKPLSVLELVSKFEQANGVKVPYRFAERRAGDIAELWADPSRAMQELGWRPVVPLEETLKNAWHWQKIVSR